MEVLLNTVKIIFLIISAASFVPQYGLVLSRRDCEGLSLIYLLINLIVATQQLALWLFFIVDHEEVDGFLVHSPLTVGDWLNLGQFAVVLIGHLILFGAYLFYPPPRPGQKTVAVLIYIAFLFISVFPVLFIASLPPTGTDSYNDRRWPSAIFFYISSMLVNPMISALALVAYLPQARELRSRSDVGALRVLGLALQGGIFLAVAIFWPLRFPQLPLGVSFFMWYQIVGWALVDNLIFVFVQAMLWWLARRFKQEVTDVTGETAPLIAA
ncbi:hypothetical protein QQX98_006215 [Neonectria punicea]|uniref:Uncharacterized protein n=1 Tax=Neonectria punicea TaxID=979145 RepID=A0ABR1H1Z2_9HYPO